MRTLLKNGRILDGLGNVIEKGWILIEDRLIGALGQDEPNLQDMGIVPGATTIVNIEGNTILPGLIDVHVHLSMNGSPDPVEELARMAEPAAVLLTTQNAKKTLRAGITGVRDLGSRAFIDTHVRDAIASGLIRGPKMKCAGQMICITGGQGWPFGYEADGPYEVMKGVRTQIRSGVDVIKLMATGGVLTRGGRAGVPHLNADELEAGIREAHKVSLKTAAHAQGLEGARNAVRAGIDSIEHGISLDDELIQEMIEGDVFLVPTLSAPFRIMERGIEANIPEEYVEKTRRVRDAHLESVSRAREAGVKIAMGTDAGTPFNLHGENGAELFYMVKTGFSEMEAIVAATSRAAELLDLHGEVGHLAPGMKADLILTEGNPLDDIRVLSDPERITVYQDGKKVSGCEE